MKLEDIKSVGVMGGGVMGGAIAQTTAVAGYKTIVRVTSEESIKKRKRVVVDGRFGLKSSVARGKLTQEQMNQALANLTFTTKVEGLRDCDLVIESVPENMELKQKVFAELDKLVKKEAIFASNASALTHAEINKPIARKSQYIGMHWSNPANIMKGIELIYTSDTSEEVIQVVEAFCRRLGKTSVRVKDMPGNIGYIFNRVMGVVWREAQKIVDEGRATEKDVDTIMKAMANWPAGPFETRRYIPGLDH